MPFGHHGEALLLSDLDDAVATSDDSTKRRAAAEVYRAAEQLARSVTHAEIDRLTPEARTALATRFKLDASATALHERFNGAAEAALRQDLATIESAPAAALQRKLSALQRSVTPLPDDRGRLGRQLSLCWAAIPAWIGLENEEAKLRSKPESRAETKLDHIALWHPQPTPGDDLLGRFAPIIAVEWPEKRAYPEADDRIGSVRLHRAGRAIAVTIDTTEPRVYGYRWTAKIHGRRYQQLVYVWWFPARPEMVTNDLSAGRIDGGILRLTLDAQQRPIIGDSTLNCGCGHAMFVSKELERAARAEFGEPLRGNRFALEQDLDRKHDVIISDEFEAPPENARPVVFLSAG